MNFKRKNKTNRSLKKKLDGVDYSTPKNIKRLFMLKKRGK